MLRLFLFELKFHLKNIYQYVYIYGFYGLALLVFFVTKTEETQEVILPLALLLTLVFSCLLLGAGSYEEDRQSGYISQLRLSVASLESYVFAKTMVAFLLGCAPIVSLIPLLRWNAGGSVLAEAITLEHYYSLLLLAGFSGINLVMLLAAIISGIARAGFVLGMLTLPLFAPVIIFASSVEGGVTLSEQTAFWLLLGFAIFIFPANVLLASAALKK